MHRAKRKRTVAENDQSTRMEVEDDRNGDSDQDGEDEMEGPTVNMRKIKDEYEKPDVYCWGCRFGFRPMNDCKEFPELGILWTEFQRQKGTTTLRYIAKHLETLFNVLIYRKMIAEGKPCLPWPKHIILVHLTPSSNHMIDEEIWLRKTLQDYHVHQEEINNSVHVQTSRGRRHHDTRLKNLDVVTARISKLYERLNSLKKF